MAQDTVAPVVGRKFKTRDGRIAEILQHDPKRSPEHAVWPFGGKVGTGGVTYDNWWTAGGRELEEGEDCPDDLVEMLP